MTTISTSEIMAPARAELLEMLQQRAFNYFRDQVNPANGLIADSTWEGVPSSIAAVGFGLAAYAVGVERGFITREDAVERTLTTLRFLHNSPQGPEPEATGYKGFYYHFLDMQTGQRTWKCELSTIDSACLIAGVLANTVYFDGNVAGEREIRQLADTLYQRMDWVWAQNGGQTITHGWKPETGFLKYRWEGFEESLFMYALGLGSPLHPLPPESYTAWTSTFRWKTLYGYDFLYAAPLFIHQFSHLWIDFRGLQDDFMRTKGLDYFENSRRATYVQQHYAIENPQHFAGYHENGWGLSASEGPGEVTEHVDGGERRYFGYRERGVPELDDGTLSPWVVIASLPFAPEIVLPTIEHYQRAYPAVVGQYGFCCSVNPTFHGGSESNPGWISKNFYGLNEGPVIFMIENYQTGLIWRIMQQCPYLVEGLRRAGFRGGWL
jgi:hypothetical protein